MSVTIHWRPVSEKSAYFRSGTSTSLDKLKRTFGNRITEADMPALHSMCIAASDPFYDEVAQIIERVGEIEVWGEH